MKKKNTKKTDTSADKAISSVRFNSLMDALGPFEKKPVIAIALSGGADSMALSLLADKWAKSHGGKIVCLTVDHGLRKESAIEAKQVAEWLSSAGIEHHILINKNKKPESNIQSEARLVRYELMTEWCKKNNILYLLVAHNIEDQAETFLLRLERGSGVDGLSGMAPVSEVNNISILRPLLTVGREELRSHLRKIKQRWVEDPTNKKDVYKRNALRKILSSVAENEEILTKRLSDTTKTLANARLALEQQTAREMAKIATIHNTGFCLVKKKEFMQLPDEIALRLLSSVLTTISGNIYRPRFEKLSRLFQAIKTQAFKGGTLWGCDIFLQKENIAVCREYSAIKEKNIKPGSTLLWDDRFEITIRKHAKLPSQLKISALGKDGVKNIIEKKEDSKIIKSIPKKLLYTIPCLKISGKHLENIIFVPHINYQHGGLPKDLVICRFNPPKPLAGLPFGCYC